MGASKYQISKKKVLLSTASAVSLSSLACVLCLLGFKVISFEAAMYAGAVIGLVLGFLLFTSIFCKLINDIKIRNLNKELEEFSENDLEDFYKEALKGPNRDEIEVVLSKKRLFAQSFEKFEAPILYAITVKDNIEAVKILIECKVDLDIVNKEGNTALHESVIRGALDITNILLQAGANTEIVNKAGNTVLHEAIISSGLKAINMLVRAGANTEIVNKAGNTVLSEANIRKRSDVADILSKAVAKTNIANQVGKKVFYKNIR